MTRAGSQTEALMFLVVSPHSGFGAMDLGCDLGRIPVFVAIPPLDCLAASLCQHGAAPGRGRRVLRKAIGLADQLRHIYVYASTDGSANYTMVTIEKMQETNSWYSSKLDIEKKFAVVQVEWADQGYRHDGGSGTTLNLFTKK